MSPLDWGVRNFLKLSMLERWGVIPAAGDRHLAEFLPSILTEASGWGAAWGVHLTPMSDREKRPGRLHRPGRCPAVGSRAAARLALGRDDGDGGRLAHHRHAPRAAREHPQRRPVPRPAHSTPWSSRCAWSTATACGAATRPGCRRRWPSCCAARWPPRSSPSRPPSPATATSSGRPSPSIRWPAGATCATRRHGRRAAGRHRPLAPPPQPSLSTRPGRLTHPTRRDPHASRIHRPGSHGAAHDPQPAGRRPHGHRGVPRTRPHRRRRGPGGDRRRRPGRGGRGQRGHLPVRPQLPRGGRGDRRHDRVARTRPGGDRLLHHRSRGRTRPARPGGRHRRRLPRRPAVGRHGRRRQRAR